MYTPAAHQRPWQMVACVLCTAFDSCWNTNAYNRHVHNASKSSPHLTAADVDKCAQGTGLQLCKGQEITSVLRTLLMVSSVHLRYYSRRVLCCQGRRTVIDVHPQVSRTSCPPTIYLVACCKERSLQLCLVCTAAAISRNCLHL